MICLDMTRRELLALGTGALVAGVATAALPPVKLGIDLFSIRSSGWTPFQYLDYAAKQKATVVHFSEIRFIGNLDPANLKTVRAYAEKLGIEVEIGMRSICPTSKMFDAKAGTAEEQVSRMIDSAKLVGSKIVRAVLGSSEDRAGGLERHMESLTKVLRNSKAKAQDAGIMIAIENHAGDMQGWELKQVIEAAGKDFVGACLDSGNPCWTLENPHDTLDALAPYVLTSHIRDSAIWKTDEGAAVSWVRMGDGNVDIDSYVRKYAERCAGKALSMECIVTGPRMFKYRDAKFWENYRDVPAWRFQNFANVAEKGKPFTIPPVEKGGGAQREREDLEASMAHVKMVLGM